MAVSPTAAQGFTVGVDAYERSRPSYPPAVISALGLTAETRVLDLAAGTGKLTRLLRGRIVALEPIAAMAATFTQQVEGVAVGSALAEALPVRTGCLDVVTVAQAFHWFDAPVAFAECRRALRPGGTLALVFNERDDSVPWCKAFTDTIVEHAGERPYERTRDWLAEATAAGFVDVRVERHDNPVPADRQAVVDRAASTSFVAALPDDRKAACLAAIAAIVADLDEPFVFPHVTEVTVAKAPS